MRRITSGPNLMLRSPNRLLDMGTQSRSSTMTPEARSRSHGPNQQGGEAMSTLDRIIGFYGGAMNGVAYGILAALAAATAFAVVWRFITPARPTVSTDG